ncbi:arylsulfatase B-like [Littorina saxatilis]|uniref:Sulfatase N-terminal domain-containing protein n=1 Tax=Littorina saxatilis TaxID=31220 RepID=A0AAN9AW35_9CAEN
MMQTTLSFLCVLLPACVVVVVDAKPPHIVFIVADDLGWNDVGFNNPDIISPNINAMAQRGIILNQSYVQPACTPSRNAFMSGYYPFRSGLQHGAILPQQAACAPTNRTFLPQELKKLGYATHAVGKWHLGFCNWNCTPTYRGFDSFYGYYNGQEDYYNYTIFGGFDFRDNKDVATDQTGNYSTFVYQERVRQIISAHDPTTPLFLYLPLQSVHVPLEVPAVYANMYPNLKTDGRRIFSGQVTAMDDVIGNLTSFIKQKGMYNDTLFVFTADNGGWTEFYGNNYPLRGGKVTVWEGGTRAAAFLHGWGLPKTGIRYDGMMHAVDWFPTIVSAAGGEVKNKDIDGMSMWDAITSLGPSPRNEFIYNLDDTILPIEGHAAIRQGDYKLVKGFPGVFSGWYLPDQEYDGHADQRERDRHLSGELGPSRLYNLKDDPTEHSDLADHMPDLVKTLEDRISVYMKQYIKPNFPADDPDSNPDKYGGVWTPGWC